MLFPRDYDQVMHFAHHRWTQDWERDGELTRAPYTLGSYLLWMSGITYWRNRLSASFAGRAALLSNPISGQRMRVKLLESRDGILPVMADFFDFSVSGKLGAVTFWLVPMLLTKAVHQLQNTIEHLGLSHEADILNNTRSTRTNALMRWLCWQMPYHTRIIATHLFHFGNYVN